MYVALINSGHPRPSHAYTEREHLSCNTVYVLIFASIHFHELLEMRSGQVLLGFFYFRGSGRSNLCLAHSLCSCMHQYECDDVLDGFCSPGDCCQLDAGSETVPGQFFVTIAVWGSFANLAKICTPRK